jgi:ABC-type sugar transport system, periplasmic component
MRSPRCIALLALLVGVALSATAQANLNLVGWPYEADTVTDNLQRFASQNPGLSATFNPLPSDNYADKMAIAFVGKTKMDVVYVRSESFAQWAEAKWIVPIDSMPGVKEYVSDLPASIVAQMSYKGHLYGLPYYMGIQAMAYNKSQLKAAGIPKPPATWDELFDAARTIKGKHIVEYPIALMLKKGQYVIETLELLTAAMGGSIIDAENEPKFTDPNGPFQSAVRWIRKGLAEGLIDPASLSFDDHDIVGSMSAGTSTFSLGTDYNIKTMNDPQKSSQAGNITNCLIPGNASVKSGTINSVRFYAISATSPNKDSAWKLLQFLGGKDATGRYFVPVNWATKFGLGFVYNSIYKDPDIVKEFGSWINLDVKQEQAKYAVDRPYRFTPWFQTWNTEAQGTLHAMISESDAKKDMQAPLASLAKSWKSLKDQYKK